MTDEPVVQVKKLKASISANNKLSKMAHNLQVDSKVKQAEDSIMEERRENMRQLRTIKGYLSGIKTGFKTYAPRNTRTMMS